MSIETYNEFLEAIKPNNGEDFGYSLEDVREFRMSNGIAWIGNLKLKGVTVGQVENKGNGGSHDYIFNNPQEHRAFKDAVKKAYEGRKTVDVADDCFINWLDRENA